MLRAVGYKWRPWKEKRKRGSQTMTERHSILEDAKDAFNSIGICGDGQSLARLVGLHEDALDYYYRLNCIGRDQSRLWSAVGWFIPLRGKIPDDAYAFLEHIFCLNGCPPVGAFINTVASRGENVAMYGQKVVDRYGGEEPKR